MSQLEQSPHVIEPTTEGFVQEVVERSETVLVVIDFWAEWCAPCRILGPTLEKLAAELDGKFILAKINTEKLPEIAQGFDVRSIPAVFAIKGGKVVSSFVGVQPEGPLRDWIEKLLPTPAELLAAEARTLEATDPVGAESRYREALALSPDDVTIKLGLARVALSLGKLDEVRATITALERRGYLEPEAETLKAELTVKGKGEVTVDLASLRSAFEADPRDKETQLKLAEILAAHGESEEALSLALDLVERDRRGSGESARKLMLAIFQLLPADSELANDYRRRLSFAL